MLSANIDIWSHHQLLLNLIHHYQIWSRGCGCEEVRRGAGNTSGEEKGGGRDLHLSPILHQCPLPQTLNPVQFNLWNQVQNRDYSTWQQVVLESWRLCPLRSVQNLPLIINIWFHVSVTQVRGAGEREVSYSFSRIKSNFPESPGLKVIFSRVSDKKRFLGRTRLKEILARLPNTPPKNR